VKKEEHIGTLGVLTLKVVKMYQNLENAYPFYYDEIKHLQNVK